MKFKSTLGLGMLLVGGVIAVYLLDYKPGEEKKVIEKLSSKLIQLDSKNIIGVELTSEYGSVSLTKNTQNGFTINSPITANGDKNAINSLIKAAENIKKEREIVSGENLNLEPYGLATPLVKLQFLMSDSSVTGISLGKENPTGEYIFASAIGDDRVFTIPKSVFSQTNKKLFDLRDKNILLFKSKDVTKIFVRTKNSEYEIERLGNGFLMVKPAALNLESGKVNSLLSRLANGKVKIFIDADQPSAEITGLTGAKTEIRLEISNPSRELRFEIGNSLSEDGKAYRYAKDASRSTIMLIDSSLAGFLERRPFELISKEALSFDKNNVDAFNIRYGDVDLKLSKDDTVWNVNHPEKFRANTDKVDELLKLLLSLKVSAVEEYDPVSLKRYMNKYSDLTITLYQDSVEVDFIRIGKKAGDESFLKSGGTTPVYRILNSAVEKLKVTVDYFRKEES